MEARQIKLDAMYTGRLPNDVLNGTLLAVLSDLSQLGKGPLGSGVMNVPYEVTETKNQDTDSSELHSIC